MKIEILDTTIREGEQSPNVSFSIDQKIEIVKELDEFTKEQDYNKLEGHGGAFIVAPLDQYKIL